MSTRSKKELIWGIGFFLFVLILIQIIYSFGTYLLKFNNLPVKSIVATTTLPVVEIEIAKNIKLAFVGDIMLDRGVKSSVYKNFNGDYTELFSKVKIRLQNYDFLAGNLEGPVSDKGENGGSIYSFRMEPVVLPALAEAGFDSFSLANNHILNYGFLALSDTRKRLEENNLTYLGQKPVILGGVSIMTLPFNEFANLDLEQMKNEIVLAKQTNDLIIAYFHFGEEYQTEPNEYQRNVVKLAIDSGADLVVGSHPHVVQTLEKYKNVWIAYSLGNFIFDQYFSPETMSGGLLEVEINPQTKKIEKVGLKKVTLNKYYQVESIE